MNNTNNTVKIELIIEGIFKFSHILDLQMKLKELDCTTSVLVRYILKDIVNLEIQCSSYDEFVIGIQNLSNINISIIEQHDNFIRIQYHLPD